MDLELLDRLEEKVDVAVGTVGDLRTENELLKEEIQGLEEKVGGLSKSLEDAGQAASQLETFRGRCDELEKKLNGVKSRIVSMVEKMKALEG